MPILELPVLKRVHQRSVAAVVRCVLVALLVCGAWHGTLAGLFVVRTQDPARKLADLKSYTFFFGPADSAEKHSAAVAALRQAGVAVPFVTAFVTERVPAATQREIVEALVSVRDDAAVLQAIESKEGFERLETAPAGA